MYNSSELKVLELTDKKNKRYKVSDVVLDIVVEVESKDFNNRSFKVSHGDFEQEVVLSLNSKYLKSDFIIDDVIKEDNFVYDGVIQDCDVYTNIVNNVPKVSLQTLVSDMGELDRYIKTIDNMCISLLHYIKSENKNIKGFIDGIIFVYFDEQNEEYVFVGVDSKHFDPWCDSEVFPADKW